jgi:hypothetical protein
MKIIYMVQTLQHMLTKGVIEQEFIATLNPIVENDMVKYFTTL